MTLADHPRALALWEAAEGVYVNERDDAPEGIAGYLARNPGTCFVAEDAGTVIGVILAGHDGRRGFLYHLAVAEEARLRGTGAALVRAALDALKSAGIRRVGLLTFGGNEAGNAFWQRQGFAARETWLYRDRQIIEPEPKAPPAEVSEPAVPAQD